MGVWTVELGFPVDSEHRERYDERPGTVWLDIDGFGDSNPHVRVVRDSPLHHAFSNLAYAAPEDPWRPWAGVRPHRVRRVPCACARCWGTLAGG